MAVELRNPSTARRLLERELEPDLDRRGAEGSTEPARPSAARADPAALSRLLPPSPRDPNAQRRLRGRVAEDDRREMPPARVLLQPAPPATAPSAPRRDVGERPAGYIGEPAVDAAWLNQREGALQALRAEYEAARAAAQATPGSGPGWTVDFRGDNDLRSLPSDGRARVQAPDGRTMVFDEDAFAAHFQAQQGAQPGSALQALAQCYDADATTLLTTQPALWSLALKDHALNAGPAPAGRAMGDAEQLGTLDLYLADPQIAALIDAYGGPAAPPQGRVAQEQVRLHGQARFEQLGRLRQAMAAVRNEFSTALAQAQEAGSGPGWVERQATRTVGGEEPWSPPAQTEVFTERAFDPDAFTAWYTAQEGLANKAFASFYGQSHTTHTWQSGGEGGDMTEVATVTFDNPNWTLQGIGGRMSHTTLRPLNVNDPPRLHDRNAVGFDVDAGWVTHPSNIKPSQDIFETVIKVAIVGAVSYVSFNTLGPAAATAMGLTTTGAAGATVLTAGGLVVASAVAGAAGSAVSGAMSGNFAWRDVLRGALAGGLSAGLMNTFGAAVQGAAGTAGTVALRTTVQGGIQALLGGKFSDGALAGFASGLADLAAANMESGIEAAVKGQTLTAAQAIAARGAARVVGSAIRALGNPNDPQYAFASSFVNSLMPAPPAAGPTTEQVRELYGPDGSGTVVTDIQRPDGSGDGAVAGGPAVLPTPQPSAPPSSPPPDGPQQPQDPQDPNVQRIEIIGHRLVRDDEGNQLEVDAQGRGVMHLASGGLLAIGQVSDALPGLTTSASRISGSLLARLSPITLPLMLTGDTPRVTLEINDRLRFERFEDQPYGRLLERDAVSGQWEITRDDVREYERPNGGFDILSDAERARQGAPITTPGSPQPPQPTPPLLIAPPTPGSPGYEATPPAGPQIGTLPAEQMRLDDLIIESRGLTPGTEEHKAAAWAFYNERPNGDWSYERWSVTYDSNQTRASEAHAAADQYRDQIGWGQREVTVETTVDGVPSARRLDIADEQGQRGIEYKTGYQSATVDNLWEVQRDADLVKRGWQIEWVFKDQASQPLLDALDRAGIKHKLLGS